MIQAEPFLDTQICDSDLGLHNNNLNYNWAKESKEWYSKLFDTSTFIQRAYNESIISDETDNSIDRIIDYKTLNEKQQIILERIEYIAATGKSYLIKAAQYRLNKINFEQLLSVCDLPMYAQNFHYSNALSKDGRMIYFQFHDLYKLNNIQCQAGNLEEQYQFRFLLLCLRDGDSTCQLHSTEVNKVNIEKLESLYHPIAKIYAVHSDNHKAPKTDSDIARGLKAELLLTKGARIMLTANL
ncbi:2563_t:CDS:2 [Cetraspora pellucida]|uniref:2563_t:CDS:1 n=1 Tax=Cetraspora pellucida TaxID=1433469 RepID=A0A9N9I4J1_9GLOM|nr:2563_t:CDS:2 [Cetraspora pellucida]